MPSKFTLISDEEIFKAAGYASTVKFNSDWVRLRDKKMAQAQRDSCEKQYQERLQEIKNRLEEILIHGTPEYWQSFWKGLGV